MLICHKGHTDTIQVYSVTVMTHVKALQAGHSGQGTSEPITPACRSSPVCPHIGFGKLELNNHKELVNTLHSEIDRYLQMFTFRRILRVDLCQMSYIGCLKEMHACHRAGRT